MIEVGGGFGFEAKALHLRFAGEPPGLDHLEGDNAVGRVLSRLVNHAHAAAGNFGEKFIIAEGVAGDRGGSRSRIGRRCFR